MYENKIIKDLTNYNDWLSEVRTMGKRTLRIEVFFVVETNKGLKEMIDLDRAEYKQKSIWIEQKRTGLEHTNKVGFLTGPIVDRVSMEYYDKMLKDLRGVEEGALEIKKKSVYEGSEEEWCITVYSTQSAVEQVDFGLRKMSAGNDTHVKYLSFKNNTKTERIAGLQLNRLINGRVKYERLDEITLLDEAKYNGQVGKVGKLLMMAKAKGIPIFNGVEQGSGKNSSKVYVYFKPNMTTEAKDWIRKVYGTTFTVKDKKNYETSIRAVTKEEEEYSSQVNNYIADRIKEIQIKESDWGYDNRSYSEVVKGIKRNDNKAETSDELNEDDETVITDNKSIRSQASADTLTDMSEVTMQTKVILEMKEMLKQMQKEQQLMKDHINDLENTVITLAEESEETDSYKNAEEKARKIKKKRKGDDKKLKEQQEEKTKKPKSEVRRSKRLEKPNITKLTILRHNEPKAVKEKEITTLRSNEYMEEDKQKK